MKKVILQLSALFVIGLGAGALNGLLGTGGGIAILLGLPLVPKLKLHDPRSVYATALAVTLPLSLFSVFWYHRASTADLSAAWPLIFPAVAGGIIGAMLLRRSSPLLLKRLFAALLLISGVMMLDLCGSR